MFTQRHINPMLNNWLDQLLDYNFDVVHMPGILNILPDQISRLFDADPLPVVAPRLFEISLNPDVTLVNPIAIETFGLDTGGECPAESTRPSLIERAHLLGHFGFNAVTKALILNGTTWPSFREDVKQHVSSCLQCQRFNIGKSGFHPLKSISASLPFDHVAIDLKQLPTSGDGYNYILSSIS